MVRREPQSPTRRTVTLGIGTSLFGLSGKSLAQEPGSDSKRASAPGSQVEVWKVAPGKVRLRPDASEDAQIWRFDGKSAPVFKIKHGEACNLRLENDTTKPLTLHFHGVRGPNPMDGVGGLTQKPVMPGESFDYGFTPPDAGTYLIRPCILGGSAEPTERGLTALLIVEEASPPPVDQDLALLIDDWRLTETGALAPFDGTQSPSGRLGNMLTTNGKAVPQRIEVVPGSRIRLRLANACNARILRLRFDDLKPFVIGVDGQPTDTFEPLRASLPFAPGTRYDVLVDMPPEAGKTGRVTAMLGDGVALVELVTGGAKAEPKPAMTPIPENKKLPEAIRLQDAARADLTIGQSGEGASLSWLINGKKGSTEAEPLLKVKRGTPVVLALKNDTPFSQPFHLHGHVFRLLHPLDDGWEPYFLDTVQVPEKRTIRIAFVADNPGKWLLASMVMERFDAGLWTWFEVT